MEELWELRQYIETGNTTAALALLDAKAFTAPLRWPLCTTNPRSRPRRLKASTRP